MKGAAHLSHITGTPGWESREEQDLLFRLAHDLVGKKAVIVEIGGEFGMSASILSKAAPDATIYSVDISFSGDVGQIHKDNLAEAGVGKNVHQIAADSHKPGTVAILTGLVKDIDLLFLDGDHTFAGALADLTLWTPLVKVGGKLASHDNACKTNPIPHVLHHEVSKAVAEWLADNGKEWKQVEMVYSTLVFERVASVTQPVAPEAKPITPEVEPLAKPTRGRPKK